MIIPIILLMPIIAAVINYLSDGRQGRKIILLIQTIIVSLCTYLFVLEDIVHEAPMTISLGGYDYAYAVVLQADPISALMILMSSLVFFAVIIYEYHSDLLSPLLTLLLMILQSLILSTFMVQDLFTIYALSEVATITVTILIMYRKNLAHLYEGMVYLLVNVIAMTFFLVGIGYIYKQFGTTSLLILSQQMVHVTGRDVILPYAFLLTGISTKILFLPVFSWLTKAHVTDSAPYIVSALLSALYIKTGIFIFIRLQQVFAPVLDTSLLFMVLAFSAAVAAAVLGAIQKDIKYMLAYSTVSQIGLILFGLSIGTDYAYYGAVYHILNHGILKLLLFLAIGIVIERYNTRKIDQIKGIFLSMPLVGTVIIIALLGLTGAPLFNGSITKYLIQEGIGSNLSDVIMIFMNLFTFMYTFRIMGMLIGKGSKVKAIPRNQQAVLLVLGLLCLVAGVFGQYFVNAFFQLSISWTRNDYLEKGLIYLLSFITTVVLSRYLKKHSMDYQVFRSLELTFNEIVASVVFAFTSLMAYLIITT